MEVSNHVFYNLVQEWTLVESNFRIPDHAIHTQIL